MEIKKLRSAVAVICAICLTASMASCSKKENSSSVVETTTSAVESSSAESSSESSEAEKKNEQGEHLKKAYDFFTDKKYSEVIKYSNTQNETSTITKTVNGDDVIQTIKSDKGTNGYIVKDGKKYIFDKLTGVYGTIDSANTSSLVETVVEQNLPMTKTHIDSSDSKKYDVEEYTYTGDTYITVLDFCFDKTSGDLKKITTTYTVEGEDDVVETREIEKLSDKPDAITTDVFNGLKNFTELSEDERAKYCQEQITKADISTDDLSELNITNDTLKKISCSDFISIIYTYGYKK